MQSIGNKMTGVLRILNAEFRTVSKWRMCSFSFIDQQVYNSPYTIPSTLIKRERSFLQKVKRVLVYQLGYYIGHYTNIWPFLIWTLLLNLTFYLIVQGFQRTYATGAACQQRTLSPPDTWSCPTLGLACVLMSRPISPERVLSPDFWISNTPRYFSFAYQYISSWNILSNKRKVRNIKLNHKFIFTLKDSMISQCNI